MADKYINATKPIERLKEERTHSLASEAWNPALVGTMPELKTKHILGEIISVLEEEPAADVMKVPYRAEIVWLVIRHALAWHDNPEGMPGCVSYYDPMNRSDQPQPKIELKPSAEKDGPTHDGKYEDR